MRDQLGVCIRQKTRRYPEYSLDSGDDRLSTVTLIICQTYSVSITAKLMAPMISSSRITSNTLHMSALYDSYKNSVFDRTRTHTHTHTHTQTYTKLHVGLAVICMYFRGD